LRGKKIVWRKKKSVEKNPLVEKKSHPKAALMMKKNLWKQN